jgi:hypothetical protein
MGEKMSRETRLGNKPFHRGQPAKILQRKFMWVLLASLSAMAFLFAPAMIIFVLNHEQKQCATFWPGDEYVYYRPPEPWQEANPDSNGMLQSQFGSCNYNEVKKGTISNEDCCQKLGYTFIGQIEGVVEKRDYGLTIGLLIWLLFILINRYWVPIAIFLVIILAVYLLRKRFKKNANEQKTTGEQNDS